MSDYPTSMRFTASDKALLDKLSVKLGIKQTSVIQLAIRKLAESEKVKLETKR